MRTTCVLLQYCACGPDIRLHNHGRIQIEYMKARTLRPFSQHRAHGAITHPEPRLLLFGRTRRSLLLQPLFEKSKAVLWFTVHKINCNG